MRSIDIDLKRGTYVDTLLVEPSGPWPAGVTLRQTRTSGEYVSPVVPVPENAPSLRLSWTARWTTPLRYTKHPTNPVYGPHKTGDWDDWTNGVSILRALDHDRYLMFFCSRRNGIGIAQAPVSDPTNWEELPGNPILRPLGDGHWEGTRINQPRAVRLADGRLRLYYTGWGRVDGEERWSLGLAESEDDGRTWRRLSDQPILPFGPPGSYDGCGACVPHLLFHEGRWLMWYTAAKSFTPTTVQIALAESEDGIRWRKHPQNPVLPLLPDSKWETSVVSRPYVIHENGLFKMWYSMRGPTYRIGYAESPDGVHWERSPIQPILDVSPEGWDSEMVEYPEIDIVEGSFRMWYCGNGFGTVGYTTGEEVATVKLYVRSGDAGEPGDGWSNWSGPFTERGTTSVSIPRAARFVQVKAVLETADDRVRPILSNVSVCASAR